MAKYIELVQDALKQHKERSTQVPDLIVKIMKSQQWQKRDPAPGKLDAKLFEYFPEFVEAVRPWGLQVIYKELESICAGFGEIELALGKAKTQKEATIMSNEFKRMRKTDKQRNLEKLEEHRPDLFKKVISNELSVNKAMMEGGFLKVRAKVEKTPDGFAKYINDNFSQKEKAALVKMLLG